MKPKTQYEWAVYWSAQGFPVFPCEPGGKKPATKHGFKDATIDALQIDEWWANFPDFNIGTCPEDNGVCIIDVDDKPGKFGSESLALLETMYGELPVTRTTHTPSGGRHLWFTGSLPSTASKMGKDIDTRGKGGYILLPGSVIDGVEYTLEDHEMGDIKDHPWVGELCFKKNIRERAATDEEDAEHNIDRARAYLEGMAHPGPLGPGCGTNEQYYVVFATLKDIGLSEGVAISLVQEIWNPRCDEGSLDTMTANVWKYSQNEAGSKGLQDPIKTFTGLLSTVLTPPDRDWTDLTPENKSEYGPGSPFYAYSEAEQDAKQEPAWIIDKRIPELSTVMYYGSPGSFKSFVVLDEVLGASLGRAGFKMKEHIKPQIVVYVAGEAALGIQKKRRPAWRLANELVEDLPFRVIENVPWVADPQQYERFIKTLEYQKIKPDIIVFDTLARAMTGLNENDAMDAGRVVAAMDAVKDHFGCTIILIHHSGKDESRGARGSTAFIGGFDVIYEVTAALDSRAAKIVCKKMKDAEEAPDLYVKGYSYKIGDGDSLVFRGVTATEYRELTRSQYDVTRQEVGAALIKLNAYEPRGVPTKVLSAELLNFVEDETQEDSLYRATQLSTRLLKRAKSDLRAYIISAPGERVTKWGAIRNEEGAPSEEPAEEIPAWSD